MDKKAVARFGKEAKMGLALVGLLLATFGFLLVKRLQKRDEPTEAPPSAAAAASSGANIATPPAGSQPAPGWQTPESQSSLARRWSRGTTATGASTVDTTTPGAQIGGSPPRQSTSPASDPFAGSAGTGATTPTAGTGSSGGAAGIGGHLAGNGGHLENTTGTSPLGSRYTSPGSAPARDDAAPTSPAEAGSATWLGSAASRYGDIPSAAGSAVHPGTSAQTTDGSTVGSRYATPSAAASGLVESEPPRGRVLSEPAGSGTASTGPDSTAAVVAGSAPQGASTARNNSSGDPLAPADPEAPGTTPRGVPRRLDPALDDVPAAAERFPHTSAQGTAQLSRDPFPERAGQSTVGTAYGASGSVTPNWSSPTGRTGRDVDSAGGPGTIDLPGTSPAAGGLPGSSGAAVGGRTSGGSYARVGPTGFAQQPTVPAADRAAAPGGNEVRYVVQPGDSFWGISRKLFGVGDYYKAIYEHNRARYPRPEELHVGDELVIPSAEVLRQTYPELCPKPLGNPTAAAALAANLPPGGRIYTVRQGDSLFNIARHELGRPARWVEIYELNRELLGDDFNYLRPGMQLVLPAPERQADSGRSSSLDGPRRLDPLR